MTTQFKPGPSQQAEPAEAPVWRDRKRRLWLMGLITPTALFVMLPLIWGMITSVTTRSKCGFFFINRNASNALPDSWT